MAESKIGRQSVLFSNKTILRTVSHEREKYEDLALNLWQMSKEPRRTWWKQTLDFKAPKSET